MSTQARNTLGLYTRSSEPLSTRARILDAALILVQQGPGPISMGAIARAAGLSRQALYLVFADKADLFIALLRYADGRRGLVAELTRIRRMSSGVEALLAIVALQSWLHPARKPLAEAFEILRRQDPAAEQAWQDQLDQRLAGCRAVVERIAEEGRLNPGLDPEVAADLIWTLTSLATWDDLVTRRGWTAEEYRDRLSALILSQVVV